MTSFCPYPPFFIFLNKKRRLPLNRPFALLPYWTDPPFCLLTLWRFSKHPFSACRAIFLLPFPTPGAVTLAMSPFIACTFWLVWASLVLPCTKFDLARVCFPFFPHYFVCLLARATPSKPILHSFFPGPFPFLLSFYPLFFLWDLFPLLGNWLFGPNSPFLMFFLPSFPSRSKPYLRTISPRTFFTANFHVSIGA